MELLNPENFVIREVQPSEFEQWLKEEFHDTHPEHLVKQTFPEVVMDAIGRDHHKSRDGAFRITYDHYAKKWFVGHPGYVREAEASGDTYLEAASNFLIAIRRENAKHRFVEIERAANERLPPHLSVEMGEHSITLYECKQGDNEARMIQNTDIEGKSIADVVEIVNDMLTTYAVI